MEPIHTCWVTPHPWWDLSPQLIRLPAFLLGVRHLGAVTGNPLLGFCMSSSDTPDSCGYLKLGYLGHFKFLSLLRSLVMNREFVKESSLVAQLIKNPPAVQETWA